MYEFLKRFKGLKRVDNYIKSYKYYKALLDTPGASPEDKEVLLLDKERQKEEYETYKIVERIIAERTGAEDKPEYFCKWTGLNYEHCTWESQDEIKPIAKAQIEAYRRREGDGKFPYKSVQYARNQRPTFTKIPADPEYIKATGGELKDFQLTGLNWLAYLWSKGENGILADEMGLGKVDLFLFTAQILLANERRRLYKPSHSSRTSSTSCTSTARSLSSSPSPLLRHGKPSLPTGLQTST